jgi:uncharacterized protein (DUF362 family)
VQSSNNKSAVRIRRGDDLPAMIRACAEDSLHAVTCPGDSVLLKPNLNGIDLPDRHISVHIEALIAVVRILQEAGAREILIAEDLAKHKPTMQIYEESGLKMLEKMRGVHLVALEEHPHRPVQPDDGLLNEPTELSALALDCDKLVSLTNLKTHHQAYFTGALKNQYTFLPNVLKSKYHRGGLECAIVDINLIRKPDFVVVDGMIGQEGLGPRRGSPVHLGLAMAGSDPVAIDWAACQIMGINPAHVRYLNWATEKGLGHATQETIEVDGPPIASLRRPFKTNVEHINELLAGHARLVVTTPCSGCIGAAVTALHLGIFRFGKKPEDFEGLTVAVGPLPEKTYAGPVYQTSHGPDWPDGPVPCQPYHPPSIDQIWDGITQILGRHEDVGLRHF